MRRNIKLCKLLADLDAFMGTVAEISLPTCTYKPQVSVIIPNGKLKYNHYYFASIVYANDISTNDIDDLHLPDLLYLRVLNYRGKGRKTAGYSMNFPQWVDVAFAVEFAVQTKGAEKGQLNDMLTGKSLYAWLDWSPQVIKEFMRVL